MSNTTCPQCGTVNPTGARFCRACGLSLSQRPRQTGALPASTPGVAPAPVAPTGPATGTTPTGPAATGPAPTGAPTAGPTAAGPAVVTSAPVPTFVPATGIGAVPLAPGVTLENGRYAIDRPLGKGGMGSVFLARDTHVNGKLVVIKEMANVYATEEERHEAEAEFRAEMTTLAALSHPNIPAITDFFTESNRHFAVQEYVPGQDLQKAIEAVQVPHGPPVGLPEKTVLSAASQTLAVLDYLAAQDPQVIHRDIKPANILVDANNRVKVVDFGIASHKFKPGTTRAVGAQLSTALGTPGYAPKEQFTGQETTRSDLYALGATMHHLLTGRDPTKIQPLWQYPPARTLNPKVSEATTAIVARAVQNDEKKRYQSAALMKKDVDRVLTPPAALSTARGRAIALLALLVLVAGSAGGALIYARQPHPVSPLSAGAVAFDTDQTDLGSLGVSLADGQKWADTKTRAAQSMAGGHTAAAMSAYAQASGINRADAESLIYQEDNRAITADPHAYKIAVGVSLSPAADGTDDVSVGRQNLQGAYLAQKTINDAGGANGHKLYLVVANDGSSKDGAAAAAQKLATQGDILALVGFAYSARTKVALPDTAQRGIPVIAPTASSPDLNSAQFYHGGVSYFFRTCPGDAEQGKEGSNYLLGTLLKGTARPTVAVFGDPNDAYANRLSGVVRQEATARGARVISETYTIGQQDFSDMANSLQTRHVDGVYFAGYAREALKLSQAMDGAGVPQDVPIMSDDGFYKPVEFSDNGTPKGRFHFTSYFFPDQYNLPQLDAGQKKAVLDMEQTYKTTFLNTGAIKKGGYGTSRVSADTALYYDAVGTVAYALGHVGGMAPGVLDHSPGAPARASLRQALATIGSGGLSSYQGIAGRIDYLPPGGGANGDPVNKALVVLRLDAAFGRTHLDGRLLGRY